MLDERRMNHFADDQRGSILVAGACMGIILVLCAMHVIGVTEAILVRSMGQNASDAIALESAVWHAQGMNLLVMINLIMAAVMSLLLAIRIVEIVIIGAIAIVAIAAAVISFFTFGAAGGGATAVIEWLTDALIAVQRFEDRVSEPIMRTLTYAAQAERAVASITPLIAVARPVTRSNDMPGFVWSVSLFPAALEQVLSKAPQTPIFQDSDGKKPKWGEYAPQTSFPARMGTLWVGGGRLDNLVKKADKAVASKKFGKSGMVSQVYEVVHGATPSLPAQEEDFYELCSRSGELLSALFLRVLGGPLHLGDSQIEKISSFVGVVVGSMQTIACTPLKAVGDTIEAEIDKAVDTKCKEQEDAWKNEDDNKGKKWDDDRKKKCKDDEKKKSGYKKPTEAESIKVARLWGIIKDPKNSPFLHVWATTQLESRFKDIDPANTMAEFRHICDGGTDSAGRGCSENSLWRPGWYAKLVPVRHFNDELANKFGDALAGWFSRALGRAISGVIDDLVKKFVPKRSDRFDEAINRQLGTALRNNAGNGWWNRRFLTGEITKKLDIQRVSLLELERYPEYLH